MLRSALEYLTDLRKDMLPTNFEDGWGNIYHRDISRFERLKPVRDVIRFNSLESLAEFINEAGFVGTFVRVCNHENVELAQISVQGDQQQIHVISRAVTTIYPDVFEFGKWFDPEEFAIALRTQFQRTDDLNLLLDFVAKSNSSQNNDFVDDGVSQTVSLKAGVALKNKAGVQPFWLLRPYCTFRDFDQPRREVLLRLKYMGADSPPKFALFESDGGEWKLIAMRKIKIFLEDAIKMEDPPKIYV